MTQPEPAGRRQRLLRRAAEFVALLVVAVVAIAVAIKATPVQTVNVAGQVVTVGTTAPSWSLSGPGEVDLFGQCASETLLFPCSGKIARCVSPMRGGATVAVRRATRVRPSSRV